MPSTSSKNFSGASFSVAVFDAVFTVKYLEMDHKVSVAISFWSKTLRPVAVRPSSQAVAIDIGICKNRFFLNTVKQLRYRLINSCTI